MDFNIDLTAIGNKNNEFNGMNTNVAQTADEYSRGYLPSLSGTEIGSLITSLNNNVARLKNGYNNSNIWIKNYTTDINKVEDNLSNLEADGIDKPTEFKSEFIDIFSKVALVTLKTGYEPEIIPLSAFDGHMTGLSYNGQDFYVVNTKIPVTDYAKYVYEKGCNQNAGLLGGQCMILSQYYAMDMMSGKYTSRSAMSQGSGSPATRINEPASSTDERVIREYLYRELSEGNPCALQVSQVKSYLGLRHIVTAVGYASDVKSADDLTPDKILVLDCVDGKIQTLGQSRSEGGHERYIFAQGGKYLAYGPTEKFKASIGV